MTAPNDPPASSGDVGGDGTTDFAAQRRAAGAADPVRTRTTASRQGEPRHAPAAGHHAAADVDERLRRFPAVGRSADPIRGAGPLGDAYGSELPDLSEPPPRPVQRTPRGQPARSRGPVRASMQIRRIDPWSTLKVSLLLSGSLFFVWMFAVALLYLILGAMGVWSKLSTSVQDVVNPGGGVGELVSAGSIFGGAALVGLVNIVLLTAMATVGALIYNLSTDLVGGIEVTLADRD